MLICPGCKAVLKEAPATGVCPKCGHPVRDVGVETEGPHAPTQGATQDFAAPPVRGRASDDTDEPAVTQDIGPAENRRSLRAAPRKLSAKSIENITNSWQGAVSRESTPRSSLKLDSKGSGGGGSSLVVNLRRVRNVETTARPTTGADYELLQVIGKGGMGVVYSARQASVDRMVAVKMIRPSAAGDEERREKFLSEAVVTGDLDHPNIVPIYELGTDENNALFYSMKRVQGTPWSQVIGRKPLAENLEILMKVADAVAFAHANSVVHRDLKPENVMLGDFGEVLVMDWGLALATGSFRHTEFVTRADSMGGTPAYMAPEMVVGPFDLIGPVCDIYLLGGLLFEVVTGLRPHTGKSSQQCLLAAARNEIQPTEKSGELVEIAYRAMATEPAGRYASVQEFQAAIRDYQSHMESISLSTRAEAELAQARPTGDYQGFARALFGFEEALALWDGNARARSGASKARVAYATSAKQKGDFELGISLLDAGNADHAPLRAELEEAQRERDARNKWLSRFKRIAAALVVVVFGVISVALVIVAEAKNQETAAKQQAFEDRDKARKAETAAESAREEERKQKVKAVAAEKQAQEERNAAREAEDAAKVAQQEEARQKKAAIEAEKKALLAKQGEEQAAYVARIGMAAAKIEENAFDTAESLLAACQPESLRNWEWGYLKRLCGQGRNFPATGTVNSVAFSPDGAWFVTAGQDKRAHLWDRGTGQERTIDQPSDIQAVAVSPDSQYLATAGGDGVVRIFRAGNAALVRELAGHQDRILGLAYSPHDGRWLLSSARDGTTRVWDTAAGRQIAGSPLEGHYGWVWSAAFSSDERRIVTAGQDGKVIVWSLGANPANADQPAITREKVFLGHQGAVYTAVFSPDCRQVASGGDDKRVLLWRPDKIEDIEMAQLVAVREPIATQQRQALEGHSAPVRSLAFTPDGEFLLSAGDDNTVRIWDVETAKPHAQLRGHSRPVLSCAISSDGRQVLSGGLEGQIKLWDIVNFKEAPHGRVLAGHEDDVLAAAFSRDGARIVTASRDHTARTYRADSGEPLAWLKEGHEFLASRALFFDGGRRLLTAGGDNTVRIWDAATGSQLQTIDGTGRTAAIAVSPDSNYILTGSYVRASGAAGQQTPDMQDILQASPQIALWDLDAERKLARPHAFSNAAPGTGHPAIVTAVAISPDSRLLFSGDDAGMGKLWDAATGALSKTLKGHTGGITGASFLPDGRRLLTSSRDGTVAQWDVASGQELKPAIALATPERRDAFDTPVTAIAVSSDGRQVLTLSDDRELDDAKNAARQSVVCLWNIDQRTLVRRLYRGPDRFTSVAFTDDGRAALAGGAPHQAGAPEAEFAGSIVRRWLLSSGGEVTAPGGGAFLDLAGRRDAVWSAIDAPGGAGLVTIGGNGATLWKPGHPPVPALLFKPHSGVTAAGFSADGKLVVTGSSDRRVKIWNAETGLAEVQLPADHAATITSASFSPTDPERLLTASSDGTARVWDKGARRVLHVLAHGESGAGAKPVRVAIFSPDGNNVLSAGDDATIRIWNAATGELLNTLQAESPIYCAAYSGDGGRILAGFSDGTAMIFDARTREPLVRYSGHTDAINSVAFSPDGRRALTGSRDRLVKIWDTGALDSTAAADNAAQEAPPRAVSSGPKTGKELLTLKYHDQAVTSVSFSPDGRSVLTASRDGTAVLWLADAVGQQPAGK